MRHGFEGVILAAFVAWILIGNVKSLGDSFAVWWNPEITQNKSAPPGFEMRAVIRPDVIVFTNSSIEAWTCEATIGFRWGGIDAYRASFTVAANESTLVDYRDFRPPNDHASVPALRLKARDRLDVQCAGKTRTHFARLE